VSAPILESRRPSSGRLIGFVLLLAAVSWGLGAFAAWPWTGSDPRSAMIRVAFKHVAAFEHEAAAAPSKEEIEKLPRHMRPQSPERSRTGRRVETVLSVALDGRLALEKHYSPGGFRHDGPTFGYEEIPVPPGRHRLEAVLADKRSEQVEDKVRRRWEIAQELEIGAGQALLLEFSEDSGLRLR
jgi:hypothetical protein